MRVRNILLSTLLVASAALAADYTGPRPPKADTLYLMHADNLIELESVSAKQDSKKDDVTYTVPGTAATAKTPLAEPIFILKSDKITPESIELYKFDIKSGHRELTMAAGRRRRGGPHAYRLNVTQLERGLYKIEASETLENGEYGLSPSGSNQVFCFSEF
jgi:hypothetical protein